MEVLETPVESLQNGDEELTDVNNVEVSEKLMPWLRDSASTLSQAQGV